jgi:hypothetical protein
MQMRILLLFFDKKQCSIEDMKNNIVARDVHSNEMYRFEGNPREGQAVFTWSTLGN